MKNISELDKNLKIETNIEREGLVFFDVNELPVSIHGVFYENGRFVRMPESVARTVSANVLELSRHTAGGRVRFVTDSPFVAIKTEQPLCGAFSHMAPAGQTGFDLYRQEGEKQIFVKSFLPPTPNRGYESLLELGDSKMKTLTIDFPLYYGVEKLYIGLHRDAKISHAPDYKHKKPMVFYGSSVTQGGCASRPGTSYQGFISRRFDTDYINLGFSGSACGEIEMAQYIADLDMSVFVLDYDFNTPSVEHLLKTHEPFFKCIREKNPDLPIIVMSVPKFYLNDTFRQRRAIIEKTVENAKNSGDKNVYFINGQELMEMVEDEGTVDGTHPTDLGFYSMASRIIRELEKIIK